MTSGSTGPGAVDPGQLEPGRWRRAVAGVRHRLSGGAGRTPTSEAELRDLVARAEILSREERRLIDDVIGTGDRHVRELMVPRNQVVFLDATASVAEAAATVRAARHSRFPVVDGSHDDVLGFVHLRDLLIRPTPDPVATVAELTRPLRALPASKGVLAALSEMRRAGDHLALVVDEYGGTAGIVTLEDLIEELVGEIHDEYDAAPESLPADGAPPAEVDGLLNLNDFAGRAGIELPAGPYDTVGGFVMAFLGRLPAVGDEVRPAGAGWALRVTALDGRRVARVGLEFDRPWREAPQAGPETEPLAGSRVGPEPAVVEQVPELSPAAG